MSKNILGIVAVLIFLNALNAISQNATKGFQLLKQNNYTDAIEAFNKSIEKKRDILASKFGLAVIYSDTTYKRFRYSRAYKHILYIESRYSKLTGSEKEILRNDYGLDDISIGKLRLKILNEAFEEAKKSGTIESLESFCLDFPNTEQSNQAIPLRNKLAFSIAKQENNPDALLDFIRKYPNTSQADSAKQLLEKFVEETYNYYCGEGELESILKFEKQYPDFKDKARLQKDKELAEMAFKLELDAPYNQNMEPYYVDYIKKAAPAELAYVTLLRTLSPYLQSNNWEGAAKQLIDFKSYFPNNHRIDSVIAILQTTQQSISVESISAEINTMGHEYAPVLTPDGKTIYFCGRSREGNIGGEDIFVSKLEAGKWRKSRLLQTLNTPYAHEAPLAISADGNRLLLYANANIFYSDKTASGWSIPKPFPSVNDPDSWEADAMMTADGNAILFISDRKGNIGKHHIFGELFHGSHSGNSDIYVCLQTESGWSKPLNLGKKINTPYSERSPFMHPDMKTLYFSSEGHSGLGRLDVFKVERLNDSSWTDWSEPINLGKEINSYGDEYDYKISTDGNFAYLSSFKSSNYDIYKMNLPKSVRPDFVAIVSGTITNKKGEPIQATIKWENLKAGEVIGYSQSDIVDGSYLIILPLGKDYGYFIEHQDYYPLSGNIDLTDKEEQIEIRKDFMLLSYVEIINDKLSIPLENVFFELNEYKLKQESFSELNRLITFIKKNPEMIIEIAGHTDDTGTEEHNKKLSQQRADAVCNYLISKGVVRNKLIAVGYGETKPIETNETEEGKAKNRRVEFKVLQK
ncbi:MAG: OmpA family protein [Bacteroidales bacterium]|nr:OmpA family protein [Bacteroidales bacterium]